MSAYTLPFYVTSFEQWCMKHILGEMSLGLNIIEYGLNVYTSHERIPIPILILPGKFDMILN